MPSTGSAASARSLATSNAMSAAPCLSGSGGTIRLCSTDRANLATDLRPRSEARAGGERDDDTRRPLQLRCWMMATTEVPTVADSADVHEQLRAATELLERIADDWRLLDQLTAEDRRRFHQAIARLSIPDPRAKRKRQKAAKAASVRRGEAVLEPDGNPDAAPAAGRHHPQRVSAGALRGARRRPRGACAKRRPANGERRTPNLRPRLLHLQGDLHARPRLLRSALPRAAPISISPRARSSRTCAAVSRCSPAGASRSATRPA